MPCSLWGIFNGLILLWKSKRKNKEKEKIEGIY
jgi:hypothetical protein